MSDWETVFWLIAGLFIGIKFLDIFFWWSWWWNSNNIHIWETSVQKQIWENSKIYKKIEKENLILENLYIQKEEIENEINDLELEASTDFEKEKTNFTRIKKLNLKIRHLDIWIEDKISKINSLNNQLKWK